MKIVLQRVNRCKLTSGEYSSEIGFGLLVTIGVNKLDTIFDVKYLARKIVGLRIFKDEDNKSNLSLLDVNGDMMIVSNFTLQANIQSGTRPDYSHAGSNDFALEMYHKFIEEVKKHNVKNVAIGSFGNHMHIDTELDGPFTIIIESEGRNHEWKDSRTF